MAEIENKMATAQSTIDDLRYQLSQQQEVTMKIGQEVMELRKIVTDQNAELESVYLEKARIVQDSERQLEVKQMKWEEMLGAKQKEIEMLRTKQVGIIHSMTMEIRDTMNELETELESAKANENQSLLKVSQYEEVITTLKRHVEESRKIHERKEEAISVFQDKLNKAKLINTKLKQELTLLRKYCQFLEVEKTKIKKDVELEEKLQMIINKIDSSYMVDSNKSNTILEAVNSFGQSILLGISLIEQSKPPTIVSTCANTQTDGRYEEDAVYKDQKIENLEKEVYDLEEGLRRAKTALENVMYQNKTLKDVIRSMKKERVEWEKEKDAIEDEVRVSKLEDSVMILKSNLAGNHNVDNNLWEMLQEVKKEVTTLKNKKSHKYVVAENENR